MGLGQIETFLKVGADRLLIIIDMTDQSPYYRSY